MAEYLTEYMPMENQNRADAEFTPYLFNYYKNELVLSIRGEVPYAITVFPLEDRMGIAAYMGYYYDKVCKIETDEPFLTELEENEKFVSIIKENDHFNLDSFPQLIDKLIEEHDEWTKIE